MSITTIDNSAQIKAKIAQKFSITFNTSPAIYHTQVWGLKGSKKKADQLFYHLQVKSKKQSNFEVELKLATKKGYVEICTITAPYGQVKTTFATTGYEYIEQVKNEVIPHFILQAKELVQNNIVPPMWLVVAKLIDMVEVDTSTVTLEGICEAKQISGDQLWAAIISAVDELPTHFKHLVSKIPDQFKYLLESKDQSKLDGSYTYLACTIDNTFKNVNYCCLTEYLAYTKLVSYLQSLLAIQQNLIKAAINPKLEAPRIEAIKASKTSKNKTTKPLKVVA